MNNRRNHSGGRKGEREKMDVDIPPFLCKFIVFGFIRFCLHTSPLPFFKSFGEASA